MEQNTFIAGSFWMLRTNDEWNGLVGIIEESTDGLITLWCTVKPGLKYYVKPADAEQILKKVEWTYI